MPILELSHATLAYEREGDTGPQVLMVQGVGVLGEGWRPQIDELGADHKLAWLDNRGIGRSLPLRGGVTVLSMAGDCLALLDHLGWEKTHLVGHSMGGLIIQEVARIAPSRVKSLALLSTLRRGRDATRLPLSNLWTSLRMRFGDERSRWLRFSELAFPPAYRAAMGDKAILEMLRGGFAKDFVFGPPILNKQLLALFRHTGGDMGPMQRLPTLIATGALDRVVSTVYSDDLFACLPHARLERFSDAGHAILYQHKKAISDLLREHIAAAEATGTLPEVPPVS